MSSTPKYLRPSAIAERYGISESALAQWRCRGEGPPFSKPSSTIVLYDVEAFERWLAARTASSTTEAARKAAEYAA
ncbi:MAG: helix-turn-helix domain-containing protein [Methylobacterium sp.]|nr:helix-turn-helix domain-containing protein [Methylobacterium sp.]MCA4921975.1 helix-turn-helix domain-containing protein [Methylobacterium sp.]